MLWKNKNESNKDIEKLKSEVEKWQNQLRTLENNITTITRDIHSRISDLEKLPTVSQLSDIKSGLDDLLLWRAKINDMLIDKTPTGKQKLSRLGKKLFGGHSSR